MIHVFTFNNYHFHTMKNILSKISSLFILFFVCAQSAQAQGSEVSAPDAITASSTATLTTFDITSNTTWQLMLSPGSDWVTNDVSPIEGNGDTIIVITHEANTDTESRMATFTLSATDGLGGNVVGTPKEITFTQRAPIDPLFSILYTQSISASSDATESVYNTGDVLGNWRFSLSSEASWITNISVAGSPGHPYAINGRYGTDIRITHTANATDEVREATFTYVDENDFLGNYYTITLRQEAGATAPVTTGVITTQAEVAALSIERFTFDGDLIIKSVQVDPITDLSPLSNITEVTGDVIIDGGAAADGLGLTSLNGLRQLQTIGGSFTISNHSALTALDTFPSLQSIGGSFRVFGNSALTNLGGFSNLANIGSTEEVLIVNTLTGITHIGSADEELPSNSISSKENVSLFIMSNPLLEDCCVLTSFFASATHAVSGEIRIGNNAVGCSDEGRIEISCSLITLTDLDSILSEENFSESKFHYLPQIPEEFRAVNTVYTANVNPTDQTFTVGIDIDNSATGWIVNTTNVFSSSSDSLKEVGDFITFSNTTGMGDGTLDIRIAENTDTAARTAVITFTPTGGGNLNARYLVITQEEAFPTLIISSSYPISPKIGSEYTMNIPPEPDTITINVALGGGAIGWGVSAQNNSGAITLSADRIGRGDGTVDIIIANNTSTSAVKRSAIFFFIPITTTGETRGLPVVLEITQLAYNAEPPTIDLSGTGITAPSGSEMNYTTNVNDTAQTLSVNIDIGGSTTGWTVSKISDPESFVTLPTTTSGAEDDRVDIIIAANTFTERSATIIFTSTGGEGNPVIRTLVITQKAGPATFMLSSIREYVLTQGVLSPVSNIDTEDNINYTANVSPIAQTLDVTVDIGGNVTGWEVSKSEDADFISLVMRDDRVGITIAANPTIEKRSATLTFTSTGYTENTFTRYLVITQTASYPTLTLSSTPTPFSVAPDDVVDYTLNVDSSSQEILVNIDLGGSAEGWLVDGIRDDIVGNDDFISFSDTTGTEDETVTFLIEKNDSTIDRSALITFLATGPTSEGDVTIARTVRITQLAEDAEPPTLTLSGEIITQPTEENPNHTVNVLVEEQMLDVNIDLGGSATGWMVSRTLDIENFITLPADTMGIGNDMVGIAIAENPTTEKRSATITFASTGPGNPIVQILVITQEGITPTLTLTSPNTVNIESTATDSLDPIEITFIVKNGATGWTTTLSGNPFLKLNKRRGNAGLDTIKAYAIANTGAERTATITLTTIRRYGGPADSRTITIKQEMGTPLTLSIFSNVDFRRGEESDTVIADATTTTFAVNIDIGGGAMGWEAEETSDLADFITLPENSGGVDGRLVIMMEASTINTDRTAVITFTTTGDDGDPITRTLVITQKRPLLLVSNDTITVGFRDTKITVSIDIDERSVTGWEAKEMSDLADFITLPENSEGVADGTLDIMVKANNLDIERETRVIFIPKIVGGGIDTVTFIGNVRFDGVDGISRPRRIELVLYLPTRKMGMDTTVELNTGPGGYLIFYDRIEAFLKRRSYTRVENIIPPTLVIRQEANPNPPHTLEISSPDVDLRKSEESDTVIVDAVATATTFTVNIDIGGSATGWEAEISDSVDFITLSGDPVAVGNGDGTVDITIYASNINIDRTATITITTTGETGNPMERTLVIRQDAYPPTLEISSSDVTLRKGEESDTAIVDATEQSLTVNIALGESTADWAAIGTSNFISFYNDRDTVGIDDGTLDITIQENNTNAERRDTITFATIIRSKVFFDSERNLVTVLDTITHTRTLIITQLASDFPTLTILGNTLSAGGIGHPILFEGGTQTFTVAIDIGSSFENWKISEVDEDDFVTFPNSTTGTGNSEVEFTLSNNESTAFRTAAITFTFTGGSSGSSFTQTLEIFQYQKLLTLSGTGIEPLSGDEKYHKRTFPYTTRSFNVSITLDDLISDWQIASKDKNRFVILPESTTGTGNGEVTFKILNNSSTTDNRADTIIFEGIGEGIGVVTRRFLVIEQEVSPSLDIENRDVTYEAGSVDIEITTGTPSTTWNVNTTASSVTSLTFTPTGGGAGTPVMPLGNRITLNDAGSGILSIAYSENMTNQTRESTIKWEALDGTGTIEIIIAQAGSPVYTGDRTLTTQEEVNNIRNTLGSATVIDGYLQIGPSDDITHLDSLYFLTEITKNFFIGGSGANNSALTNIGDFPVLQKIGGGYSVAGNTKLIHGGNFPVLESIGDEFIASGGTSNSNQNLVGTLYGYFFIRSNSKLESLGTFPRLKRIGTSFTARGHDSLRSLYEFPSLISIGMGSPFVPSAGTQANTSIVIEDSPTLASCCVLRNFFSDGPNAVSGAIYINNNAVGCDSIMDIKDVMCPPTIILESADTVKIANTATTSTDPIAITFIVSGSATGWGAEVDEDEDFITLGKSMGSAGLDTIKVSVSENTEILSRMGTIEITTMGDGDSVKTTVVITQSGIPPTLMLTSNDIVSVGASATSTDSIAVTFTVGGGATGWNATILEESPFITLSDSAASEDSGTIKVVVTENTGFLSRMNTIEITTVGDGDPVKATVVITQAAGQPFGLSLTSKERDTIAHDAVSASDIMFTVGGESVDRWTAAVIDGDNFLTLNPSEGDVGTITIGVFTLEKNGGEERTNTIVITTVGRTEATETIIVTQEAVPTIEVTDPMITIDHDVMDAQIITFDVGGSAKGWTASSNDDFVTLLSPPSGISGEKIEVMATFAENNGVERTATITISTTGQLGEPVTKEVTIIQRGVPPTLSLNSKDREAVAYDGTTVFEIDFTVGGGANRWIIESDIDNIAISGNNDFLNLNIAENSAPHFRTGNFLIGDPGNYIIRVTSDENTGKERVNSIVIMTEGGTGVRKETIIVTQEAVPTIVLSTSNEISIAYNELTSQTIIFDVGGSATGWTARSDQEFVKLDTMGSSGEGIEVMATFEENNGAERIGTITISTMGQLGEPVTKEVTITQKVEEPPTLILTSEDTTIAHNTVSAPDIDFTVGGGAARWEAKVINEDKFLTLLDSKGNAGRNTIRVTSTGNTGEARMNSIVITTEGGTGEAATDTITITQEAVPTIEITDPIDKMITIDHDVTDVQTITFSVGGSATGWKASSDDYFIMLLSPTMADNSVTGEVTATLKENDGVKRTATITITTTGQLGASVTAKVTITQSAAPIISVDPHTLMLTSGNTVDVANTATVSTDSVEIMFVVGGKATGWKAAVDEDFVTLGKSMGSSGMDTLTLKAAVTANTGIERTAIITLTTTGSTGTAVDMTIMIKQAAGSPTLSLISGSSVAVAKTATTSADSIEIMFVVGGEATGWKATVNQAFVTLGKSTGSSGTGTLTLKAAVTANTGAARTATVTITTTGQLGDAVTADVTITQATGIVPPVSNPPTLMLTSGNAVSVTNAATVPAASIEIMFTVGGGATGWKATVNQTFVTLGKSTGSSGTVTLKAAVTANAGVPERTATITLTTIGGTGTAVDATITITQAGTPLSVPTQTPLAIYPNPVGNILTIEGASTSLQISIMDFSGRQVVYSELSTGQNTLDVADLPSGLYVIIVHGEEGEVFTGQIFKK